MQSDDLDKKIQEAAEHHHPTYDESAWQKMDKLLDVHLPQKKERKRRIIYLSLMFLFLSGGAYLFYNSRNNTRPISGVENVKVNEEKNVSPQKTVSNAGLKQQEVKQPVTGKEIDKTALQVPTTEPQVAMDNKKPVLAPVKFVGQQTQRKKTTIKESTGSERGRGISPKSKQPGINEAALAQVTKHKKTQTTINNPIAGVNDNIKLQDTDKKASTNLTEPATVTIDKDNSSIADDKTTIEKKSANPPVKQNKKKVKHVLAFTVSGGMDVSGLRINEAGQKTMAYGLGLSYSLSHRFVLRSGFYTGKKIYSANPLDYHPPANFWTYYPDLKKIDADCRVSEILLSLGYKFSQSAKHSWFGSFGLSSFLMKRETYNYEYKNSWGVLSHREYTIRNQNNHYFSIATLSGGYERKLNNTFSILAEPYVKVPLTGIGYGKIKLNSAGVLFTLGINPFGKR